MTTFAAAYLIVWLAMTLYTVRLAVCQRQALRALDDKD
jgi:hypothetical protein